MKKNPFHIFFVVDKFLEKIESLVLVWTLLSVLIFAFIPVFLRIFFDTSIIWAPELNRLLVLWIGFLGAALAVKDNRHISLEVLTQFLPERFKPVVRLFVYAFVIYVTGAFTYISYHFFLFEVEMINIGDYLFGPVAKTYFKVIYPIGFGLITYHYFVKILEVLLIFIKKEPLAPTTSEQTLIDDQAETSVSIQLKG